MSEQNELMSLVVLVIFGVLFIYIGIQTPNIGYAFVIGGLVALGAAFVRGKQIFEG